ncbi:MAG: UPF0280 family protein [Desulfofustis sp.]|nr:UPF0280 family protein [Desulfofustis sp.]
MKTRAPKSYRRRSYRSLASEEQLVSSYFALKETDLHILARSDVTAEAGELATGFRVQIENYLAEYPEFATALFPLEKDELAPPIVRRMFEAASHAGVGPMAAVAGGIAEGVGQGLLDAGHKEIIVENGGDLFMSRSVALTVSIFAGQSPLSNRLGLTIMPAQTPLGVCTSSGTVGHSLSFGLADSVTVVADSAFVADAAATRLGNEVGCAKEPGAGIERALEVAKSMTLLRGVLIICGETMGAVGEIELTPLSGERR